MKLSMSVDRLPSDGGIHAGRLQARIYVSNKAFGRDISLIADENDEFDLDNLASMFRTFAAHLKAPVAA